MMLSGSIVFFLLLSALPFAGAVCRKWRPERLFLTGLLLNGLLFYLACAVGLFTAGFWLILVANLALYIPALLKMRKDPGAVSAFWTKPVRVFYLLLGIGFLMAAREHLMLWDEYSHWCTSARLLFKYHVLGCAQGGILKHASYPPGLSVLYVLTHKCFIGMEFRDFLPRFAARALLLSIFLVPFGDALRERTRLQSAAGLLGMFCIASFLFPGGVWSCESDCVMGALFAAAVYAVMRHDRSVRDDLFVALLLAWLFLVKKAGMGFAVMVLALYAVRWIADLVSKQKPRRPAWSALVVLAAPFALQATWSLLLKLHHTPIIFSVGGFSFRGIWRLVRYGEPAYGGDIARLFVRQLWPHLVCFAAGMAALGVYWATARENRPRRCGDLLWFMPLTMAVFAAMLFLTYIFIFDEGQAYDLVSFKRYMNGFMVMPYLATMMLFCSSALPDQRRRRDQAVYAVLILALLVLLGYRYRDEYLEEGWATRNWPEHRVLINARYGSILRAPDERFIAVSGRGRGVYSFILKGEYEDRFVGEIEIVQEGGVWKGPTPAELKRKIREVRHVLFLSPANELALKYAELFEDPPRDRKVWDFTLFEVTPEGLLRPVR